MSQALYRKWRPKGWEQVIGQDHIIQTLKNSVKREKIGHAYLFSGPRGTGKTSSARLLAKAVNCLAEDPAQRPCNECENCLAVNDGRFLDLIEIDAASNTSVDDIRDLRDKINFSPSKGKFKIYIIDEVHMLSTAAFNALLKTLEEPPAHALFILATTEAHKIPTTVLSRCQRHDFRKIPVQELVDLLNAIAQQENIEVNKDALTLIARQSTGAARDAISLLDQLSSTGQKIDLAFAQTVLGTAASQTVIDLTDTIINKSLAEGLIIIHQALDAGTDPLQLARQMVEFLRSLLLLKLENKDQVDTTEEILETMQKASDRFEYDHLIHCIKVFNQVAVENRSSWFPGLNLEMAVTESINVLPIQSAPVLETTPDAPQTVQKTEPRSAPVVSPKTEPIQEPVSEQNISVQPEKTKETASEPVEEITPPASGEFSIGEIKSRWELIRKKIKEQRPPAEALLNSCKSMRIKNGILFLSFASDIVKSKMESKENLDLACTVISNAIGKQVQIICEVNQMTSSGQKVKDIDADGLVNEALNLGGQIKKQG